MEFINMLSDYNVDSTLFKRCMPLIDSIFPGCKALAEQGSKYGASWTACSIPFIIEQDQEIIAHLGFIPFDFILDGKSLSVAALHAVCTKPEYRGRGHFKTLMKEALDYANEYCDSVFLFTDTPNLYTPFHFKTITQFNFLVQRKNTSNKKNELRKLSFDIPEDLKIIHRLAKEHLLISNDLHVKQNVVLLLNMMDASLYYSEKKEFIIAYELKGKMLHIKYIMSQTQYNLDEILSYISKPFENVMLHFCPDKFASIEYSVIEADTDIFLMTLENLEFNKNKPYRYPNLFKC